MELFDNLPDNEYNWLPFDGIVNYYGKVLPQHQADDYFAKLVQTIAWRNDEAVIMGKLIITKRKVAWYGDAPFAYTYSKTTKHALPWTIELLALKKLAEQASGETFNSCLLNLYHTGDEAWPGTAMRKKIW